MCELGTWGGMRRSLAGHAVAAVCALARVASGRPARGRLVSASESRDRTLNLVGGSVSNPYLFSEWYEVRVWDLETLRRPLHALTGKQQEGLWVRSLVRNAGYGGYGGRWARRLRCGVGAGDGRRTVGYGRRAWAPGSTAECSYFGAILLRTYLTHCFRVQGPGRRQCTMRGPEGPARRPCPGRDSESQAAKLRSLRRRSACTVPAIIGPSMPIMKSRSRPSSAPS